MSNIALFSPNQNPYSETFIQAHKNFLKGKIFYYYGRGDYIKLENGTIKNNLFYKLFFKIIKKPNFYSWRLKLLKSLKKNNIDSVLIEYGDHAQHLLPLLKIIDLPVVIVFHGYDASVKAIVENNDFYKEVFDLSHKVIVVSQKMRQMLIGYGCPNEKLIYTPCAPNDSFFNVQPKFSKDQFISIGRFVDKKAPYLAILAFKEVVKKHPDYILKMAGDGFLLNTCKNLVKFLGIEKNIKFLGIIEPSVYKEELEISTGFVQHSITADNGNMEGTPVAVLEASAAGIPVVSTNHAGIPEVILHNETGLLCNEKDVRKMAEHMIRLIENKNLAIALGANGKVRIKNEFNMKLHISVIQKALGSNG